MVARIVTAAMTAAAALIIERGISIGWDYARTIRFSRKPSGKR
jgi:hypothetical protein